MHLTYGLSYILSKIFLESKPKPEAQTNPNPDGMKMHKPQTRIQSSNSHRWLKK